MRQLISRQRVGSGPVGLTGRSVTSLTFFRKNWLSIGTRSGHTDQSRGSTRIKLQVGGAWREIDGIRGSGQGGPEGEGAQIR
jgi:hypothetical protein